MKKSKLLPIIHSVSPREETLSATQKSVPGLGVYARNPRKIAIRMQLYDERVVAWVNEKVMKPLKNGYLELFYYFLHKACQKNFSLNLPIPFLR